MQDAFEKRLTAAATLIRMTAELEANKQIRGIIVSGDLTNDAWKDDFEQYRTSIAAQKHFVFEGLGNHDFNETGGIGKNIRKEIWNYVGEKARATNPTFRFNKDDQGFPNYSWDWHDVHFVQLNLFPGDTHSPMEEDHYDPRYALTFLKSDLLVNVGNSGRPVVLIHHYGFDWFSLHWWNDEERKAYWNAIANYNVVLIVTGHLHPSPGSNSNHPFNKPADANARFDGKTQIPAYTAGAALAGAYLDITMNRCNQIVVRRKDRFGNFYTAGSGLPYTVGADGIARSANGTVYQPTVVEFDTPGPVASDCQAVAQCKPAFTVAIRDEQCPLTSLPKIDTGNSTGNCSQKATPEAGPFPPGTSYPVTLACKGVQQDASCTTNITVVDDANPKLNCTRDIGIVECGTPLNFTNPIGTDNCGTPTVSCTPSSGALAQWGLSSVSCRAVDSAGNQSSPCSRSVTVKDTLKPVFTATPPEISVECQGDITRTGPLSAPQAADQCDTNPNVKTTATNAFPFGKSAITWLATDASNNSATISQIVNVIDTVPPVLTCPKDIVTDATRPNGANVSFVPDVKEACGLVSRLNCDRPSGSNFAIGVNARVRCVATDRGGNSGQCEFNVRVRSRQETVLKLLNQARGLANFRSLNSTQRQALTAATNLVQITTLKWVMPGACAKLAALQTLVDKLISSGAVTAPSAAELLKSIANVRGRWVVERKAVSIGAGSGSSLGRRPKLSA